ncbi:MAG: helix-turn-helix domain-containing protein [Phycisphaerales bacterium JB041]
MQPQPSGHADQPVTLHSLHRVGPFRITHKTYSGAFCQGWHEHDEASIDFVLAGSGAGTYGRRDVVSRAGAVEFFAAGVRHRFASHTRGIRSLHIVMPAGLPRSAGIDADTLVRELDATTALGPAAAIAEEVSRTPEPDALLLESLAMRLLDECLPRDSVRADNGAWIGEVRELLLEAPELASSLKEVAARVGRHPSHVARHFRLASGVTVGEYGRRVRLARAARSLASRRAPPIVQIALEQGFADQSHFSRAFRSAYGCTPRAFRARLGRGPSP